MVGLLLIVLGLVFIVFVFVRLAVALVGRVPFAGGFILWPIVAGWVALGVALVSAGFWLL